MAWSETDVRVSGFDRGRVFESTEGAQDASDFVSPLLVSVVRTFFLIILLVFFVFV